MGHIRLGVLPKTRDWNAVVAILGGGGTVAPVASATAHAARSGLAAAPNDSGLVTALHLLMQLPLAARETDFVESLHDCDVQVDGPPSLVELTAAVVETLDRRSRGASERSDLSEMAGLAAVETLADVVGAGLPRLFGSSPEDVRAALREFGTRKQFGFLARAFFGRFIERYLGYYLSRELSTHVGHTARFRSIDEHTEFNEALRLHCFETARIVEDFAGDWLSKTKWERGAITQSDARRFAHVAVKKLNAELTRREGARER